MKLNTFIIHKNTQKSNICLNELNIRVLELDMRFERTQLIGSVRAAGATKGLLPGVDHIVSTVEGQRTKHLLTNNTIIVSSSLW